MTQPTDLEPLTFADWMKDLPPPPLVAPEDDEPGENLAEDERRRALIRSIPPSFRWARLDADRELRARVKPIGVLARLPDVLGAERAAFVGPSGAGKTSTGCAMLRAAWERSRSSTALFAACFRLGPARLQHRAGDGEAPLVRSAMTCGILLLDDLGSEQASATSPVGDVILHRFDEGLTTWVTTGLSWPEIERRYGSGLARRLVDRAVVLRFGEPKAGAR